MPFEVVGGPEQGGLRLVEPLRAPDEAVVAEEGAVLDLVLVGVAVPPAAVGPAALRVVRRHAGWLRARPVARARLIGPVVG